MCNRFANRVSYRQYVDDLAQAGLPLVFPTREAAPNLEPLDDIRPTDRAPVILPAEGGTALHQMRWGFSPSMPKAGPLTNRRSEGRSFSKGRCLIPASCFFEWTGARYPKIKWQFTVAGQEWFCIAGLWRDDEKLGQPAFTMLTMPPGPDVAPYHNRQVVVLAQDEWQGWLDPEVPSDRFLTAKPQGFLIATQVGGPAAPAEADLFG